MTETDHNLVAGATHGAPVPPGQVISVRGSHADVGLPSASPLDTEDRRVTVGKFIGMRTARSMLVGVVTDISLDRAATSSQGDMAIAHLDIVGEILDHGTPQARFQRGVTTYPAIGDAA